MIAAITPDAESTKTVPLGAFARYRFPAARYFRQSPAHSFPTALRSVGSPALAKRSLRQQIAPGPMSVPRPTVRPPAVVALRDDGHEPHQPAGRTGMCAHDVLP